MIQLYKKGNTNYDQNGDITLTPIKCLLDSTLNGDWLGSMEHPLDEKGRWKWISDDAVIKVPASDGTKQLYRIVNYDIDDNKGVTCDLEHIFYDSMDDCWIDDKRPTDTNGQGALNSIITNSKYTGSSDILRLSTAYYVDKNLMEALNGSDENSFISRWGGEIYFDNFHVSVNNRVGSDRNVEIRYGKNMNGMHISTDMRDIVTRIKPKAYNGHTMTNNGVVDSPNLDKYRIVHKKAIEFSNIKMREDAQEDDEENGIIVCDTQEQLDVALQNAAQEQFELGIDAPTVSGEINVFLLQNSKEYEDVKELEQVCLGDTVHCRNKRIDVVSETRVVHLIWDAILKKVNFVEIGELSYNYFDDVDSVKTAVEKVINVETNTVIAEKVQGVISAANAMLMAQKDRANKTEVKAILMQDTDPESPSYGALCLGTQGLMLAMERTEDGSDWKWGTAIDYRSIHADYIITGILSDLNGTFYLNMETGELVMNDGEFKGILNTYKDVGIGNWLYLGTQATDGNFSASGITVGPLDSGTDNKPVINMWGNIKNGSGSINIVPFSGDDGCGIFITRNGSNNSIQLKGKTLTINGKSGLTGTYQVENSLTVEKGLVTGVD
jgi:phage minor structural protein